MLLAAMHTALDNLKEEFNKREHIDRESPEWLQHMHRMDALLDRYLKVTGRG